MQQNGPESHGLQSVKDSTMPLPDPTSRLEDLPNIGRAIAAELRTVGILTPQQLAACDPLQTYFVLAGTMGRRHDPCVLYTLLAVQHYLQNGERLPWWKFTSQGRALLGETAPYDSTSDSS